MRSSFEKIGILLLSQILLLSAPALGADVEPGRLAAADMTMKIALTKAEVGKLEEAARERSLDLSFFPGTERLRRKSLLVASPERLSTAERRELVRRAKVGNSAYLRGVAAYVDEDYHLAADELAKVCEPHDSPLLSEASRPFAFYILGDCNLIFGNYQRAKFFLEKAAALEPNDPEFAVAKAGALVWTHHFNQAVAELERIISILNQDHFNGAANSDLLLYKSAVWDFLAVTRYFMHNLVESEQCYESGIAVCDSALLGAAEDFDVKENKAILLCHYGSCVVERAQYSRAKKLLMAAVKLCDDLIQAAPKTDRAFSIKAEALVRMAAAQVTTEASSEAIESLKADLDSANTALQIAPDDSEALLAKGRAVKQLSQIEMSAKHKDEALRLAAEQIAVYEAIHRQMKTDAWTTERKALAMKDLIDTEWRMHRIAKGKALAGYLEALNASDSESENFVRRSNPAVFQSQIFAAMGDVHAGSGNRKDAVRLYGEALRRCQKGVEADAQDPRVSFERALIYRRLGRIYLLQGKADESTQNYSLAIDCLNEGLNTSPENPWALLTLGSSYNDLARTKRVKGRSTESLLLAEKAVAACDLSLKIEANYLSALLMRGRALFNRGVYQSLLNQPEAAINSYKLSVRDIDGYLNLKPEDAYARRLKDKAVWRWTHLRLATDRLGSQTL